MVDFDVGDELTCHRCDGSLLLTARVPYVVTRADGHHVEGHRGIGLCPSCDAADPTAQGLLAYFAVHKTIHDEDEAAALIVEWTERASQRLWNSPPTEDDSDPDVNPPR